MLGLEWSVDAKGNLKLYGVDLGISGLFWVDSCSMLRQKIGTGKCQGPNLSRHVKTITATYSNHQQQININQPTAERISHGFTMFQNMMLPHVATKPPPKNLGVPTVQCSTIHRRPWKIWSNLGPIMVGPKGTVGCLMVWICLN